MYSNSKSTHRQLGLPVSTLNTIVGQQEQLRKKKVSRAGNGGPGVKQTRGAKYQQMDDVLLTWFKGVVAAGANVDESALPEKVDNIALFLDIEDIQESSGWLHRFKA